MIGYFRQKFTGWLCPTAAVLFASAIILSVSADVFPEKALNSTDSGGTDNSCNSCGGIGLSNPAAAYCAEMGYEYKVEETPDGQQGVCILPDGNECDEWSFYSGECGASFSYCTQNGWPVATEKRGDVFAPKCTTCVMPDGSNKTVSELLNLSDKCTKGFQTVTDATSEGVGSDKIPSSLPDHFDWRNEDGQDWMTSVKDQGSCGSCWAFSAVGIVESAYEIAHSDPDLNIDLSEEYLVSDCFVNNTCCGGWHYAALSFIKQYGISDEACFPYVDGTSCTCSYNCDTNCNHNNLLEGICSDATCSDRCSDWSSRLQSIDEMGIVIPNEEGIVEAIKRQLVEKEPLSVSMGIGTKYGGDWEGDIYKCSNDSGLNHAVIIVGYDETNDYWIVKNSWGVDWPNEGSGGYFKVGFGECAIQNKAYYAIVNQESSPTPTPAATPAPSATPIPAPWTFMVYLDGDNNLEQAYIQNFLYMAAASNANVNIVVQFDRIADYDSSYDNWTDCKRYLVTPGMTPTSANAVSDIGEVDMSDPAVLADFITWAKTNYPADRYLLALVNHGSGWEPKASVEPTGMLWDDTSGIDAYMSTAELDSALSAAGCGTDKLDVLFLDACLMQMIEVAYQVRGYSDYMVASEMIGWAPGPYDDYINSIDPTTTGAQLAASIVNGYHNWLTGAYPHTMSALDLAQLPLAQEVSDLATALIAGLPTYNTDITNAMAACQKYDSTGNLEINNIDEYLDLYHLAWLIDQNIADPAISSAAQTVYNRVTSAIIAEQHESGAFQYPSGSPHTWDLDNSHGISIYFPPSSGVASYTSYSSTNLAFVADKGWDEFLNAFYGLVPTPTPTPAPTPTPGPPPPVPSLKSPSSGATVPSLTPRLEWNASTGAADYGLQVATDSGFTNLLVNQTGITELYHDVGPGLLNWNTRYYWRVNARNSSGSTSNWSSYRYFRTAVGPPPNAPSDLIATAVSSSRIDLTWQDNSDNETGFKIERKTGSGGFYSQIATVGINVTSYSSLSLAASTIYYYRVRAYSAAGNSEYSNEAFTTTLPPPPPVPSLKAPSSGATVPSLTPRLEWNTSIGASDYSLQVATDSGFTNLLVNQSGVTDLYYDIPGGLLNWNTRYYWRVNARNSSGSASNWSSYRYFRTAVGPPKFAVIVGISNYLYINDLNYCDDDARDIYNRLIAEGWQASNIKLLIDSQAGKASIQAAISWMAASAGSEDLSLFFFSGHGDYGPDISPIDETDGYDEYLCPYDMTSLASSIRDDELDAWMSPIAGKKVVMIDSCFSGGFVKTDQYAIKTRAGTPHVTLIDGFAKDINKAGFIVLTACDDNELSWEYSALQNGVFAYYIEKGLSGLADTNVDGVSAEEAYSYAAPRVQSYTGNSQNPQLWDGIAGEVILTAP